MSSRSTDEAVTQEIAPPDDASELTQPSRPEESAEPADHRPEGRSWGPIVAVALGILLILVVALCAVLGGRGYRAYVMETPSMGTSAPVGSLVVVQPSSVDQLHRGDVVTVAPRAGGSTHTHRVVTVSGNSATTQGDLNGTPDPERVGNDNLVGRDIMILPVVGWLVKMLPIVLVSLLVVFLLTLRVRNRHQRFRYRALGFFCGLALSIVIVQPLLGVQLLSMRVDENADGPYAAANVVSTGIFPVRVSPAEDQGQASEVLSPTGSAGEAVSTLVSDKGEFTFYPSLVLTPMWWLGTILYCASPFLIFGVHALLTRRKRGATA